MIYLYTDWEATFEIQPVIPNLQYIWIYNGHEYAPTSNPSFYIYEFPANPITLNLRVKTSCGISDKLLAYDATYYPACSSSWKIYPNPANLFVEVSKDSKSELRMSANDNDFSINLLDHSEKILRTEKGLKGKARLNVERIPDGTYFMHINEAGKRYKKQLIIAH